MNFIYLLHHNYIFTTNRFVVDPYSSHLSLVVILLLLLKHNPFKYTYSSTVFKLKDFFFSPEISLPLECFCCALCNGVCINSTPEIALGDMD